MDVFENAAENVQVSEVSSSSDNPAGPESCVRLDRGKRMRSADDDRHADGYYFCGQLTSEVSMFTRRSSSHGRRPSDVVPGFRVDCPPRAVGRGESALDFCGQLGAEVSVFRRRGPVAPTRDAGRTNFQNGFRGKIIRPSGGGGGGGGGARFERDGYRLCGSLDTEVSVFERGPNVGFFIDIMSRASDTFKAFGLDFRFHWQLTSEVSIRKHAHHDYQPEGKVSKNAIGNT